MVADAVDQLKQGLYDDLNQICMHVLLIPHLSAQLSHPTEPYLFQQIIPFPILRL